MSNSAAVHHFALDRKLIFSFAASDDQYCTIMHVKFQHMPMRGWFIDDSTNFQEFLGAVLYRPVFLRVGVRDQNQIWGRDT